MREDLRLLIVEDSEDDAMLLVRHLRQGGFAPVFERVETTESMAAALHRQPWDLVIADYTLPRFSGRGALALLKETGFDLPFIVVSGTIGEDVAVEAMKAGAHDYILKGNLTRLLPAVQRELREAKVRQERRQAREDLLRSREELRTLTRHLDSVREEERARLARELHDELGQALTALKLDMVWLMKKIKVEGEPAERMSSMLDRTDEMIGTIRRIETELRPALLDHLGLVAAMEWQAGQFTERTGISCVLACQPEDLQIDQTRSMAIFRIFQEALTNVTRHAEATAVSAGLQAQDEALILTVADNGKGIPEERISNGSTFGLLGIKERVARYGGTFSIAGIPGGGTTVSVTIPLG